MLGLHIIAVRAGDKGEIEVPPVVEYGPAAGDPPDQLHPVALHGREIALPPGVLVAADDDGVFVDIEVENPVLGPEMVEKPLVPGQIVPSVAGGRAENVVCHRILSVGVGAEE